MGGHWYEIYNSSNAAHSFCELSIIKKRSSESKFGHYSEFVVWPFQVIGILSVVFIAVLFLLGLFCPNHYDCFIPQSKNMEVNKIAEADGTHIQNTECV